MICLVMIPSIYKILVVVHVMMWLMMMMGMILSATIWQIHVSQLASRLQSRLKIQLGSELAQCVRVPARPLRRMLYAQVWPRFAARVRLRSLWRWQGLLLWLVQRPWLRYFPLPFPQTTDLEDYENSQLAACNRTELVGTARARKVGLAEVFKDLLFLRSKMGAYLSWRFHSKIWAIILVGKSKKLMVERAAVAAAIEKYGEPSPAIVSDLLGPRGGIPKTKDKLVVLALALGLEEKGTVLELSQRCREALGRTYAQRRAPATPPKVGAGVARAIPSSSSGPSSSPQGASILVDLQEQVRALQAQLAQVKKQTVPIPPVAVQPQVVSIVDLPVID